MPPFIYVYPCFTGDKQHSQKKYQFNHFPVYTVTLLEGLYTAMVQRKYKYKHSIYLKNVQ